MEEYKLSNNIWDLAQTYKEQETFQYPPDTTKIEVDVLVSKLAMVYEKMRYAVDYREEHLIRRHAIERIIKRNFLWKKDLASSAQTLLEELIRAGYLENNTLPKYKIDDITAILEKYVAIINSYPAGNQESKRKMTNWLLTLASVEIEYDLINRKAQLKLLENTYNYIRKKLTYRQTKIEERIRNKQLYIAVHRTLLKSDIPTISYHLLQLYVKEWTKLNSDKARALGDQIDDIKNHIDEDLRNSLSDQLISTIRSKAVHFNILNDLFTKHATNLDKLLFDVPSLELEISSICNNKYKKIKRKLKRATINAIIYIFFTKIILAFIIEVPYDYLTIGHINYLPLAANVLFFPLLIFFITTTVKVPSSKNTKKIISECKNIIYSLPIDKIVHVYKKSAPIGSSRFVIANVVYSILYLLSFGVIIWILSKFGFNVASGLLFVFFLTLISFFGIRIRSTAREYLVLKRRQNLIGLLFDLISIPLIRVGRWISINSSKINIFIFLFDYILESPFKKLVEAIETGIFFVKEKKEEVYRE